MRKVFLLFITALSVTFFTACSSKSATASQKDEIVLPKGDVSTYLIGEYMDVPTAKSALESVGFEVVATYKSFKKGETIVFTNSKLKAQAAKKSRGFAAVLRLLVDDERKQISITNPVYFGKAFMQDEYDHKVASDILMALNKAFTNLKGSEDKWEFEGLASYHFMMGMPYYEEQSVLGKGSQEELITKADSYKKGKYVVFKLQLSENSTLYGYALGKRTSKFVKKIGTQNATILPYCILIEDGEAKILNAKYYIAISYPQLSMGDFMGIATVPGAVEKDLKKPFKK
jgi:hypothetical protein